MPSAPLKTFSTYWRYTNKIIIIIIIYIDMECMMQINACAYVCMYVYLYICMHKSEGIFLNSYVNFDSLLCLVCCSFVL